MVLNFCDGIVNDSANEKYLILNVPRQPKESCNVKISSSVILLKTSDILLRSYLRTMSRSNRLRKDCILVPQPSTFSDSHLHNNIYIGSILVEYYQHSLGVLL